MKASICCSLLLGLATTTPVAAVETVSLQPRPPIVIAGTHGKFDFIKVDAAHRRLLACHTGNGTLDVIDLDSSKLLATIPTGAAQGVAIDEKHGRYFVSASAPSQLVMVDADKLAVTDVVPLPAPADLVAYEPQTNRVMVDSHATSDMWIVDPDSRQVVQTNTFPGAQLEDFCFDKWGTLILQNLMNTNEVAKSDFPEGKIPAKWPTAPAQHPHGLVLVNGGDALLVAGGNGKMVLIGLAESSEGKVLASADIAPGVDEIAYDPGTKRAYAASGRGKISVVAVGASTLQSIGTASTPPGTHSIAIDAKTHTVWIAFAKDAKAYVQAFAPGEFSAGSR